MDREGRGERPGGWRMLVGSGPRKGVVLAYGASISLDKGVLGPEGPSARPTGLAFRGAATPEAAELREVEGQMTHLWPVA